MTKPYKLERTAFNADQYDLFEREIVAYDIEVSQTGKSFRLVARDPHGFFEFVAVEGSLPSLLHGQFTSVRSAEKALAAHIANIPSTKPKYNKPVDSKLPS